MAADVDYGLSSRGQGRIPGYQGYCPQFKYNFGKTFGRQTYELTKEQCQDEGPGTQEDYHSIWKYRKSLSEKKRLHTAPAAGSQTSRNNYCAPERCSSSSNVMEQCNSLPPLTTGDCTRYSRSMIPGYTGYVPRWPFKYGCTYKNECDVCLDEFGAIQRINDYDRKCALVYPRSAATSRSIQMDPSVQNYLGELRNTINVKQLECEPPIPGYKGFIPHVTTSDVGLGSRYYNMAREGYEALKTHRAIKPEWTGNDELALCDNGTNRSLRHSSNGSANCDHGKKQEMGERKDYSGLVKTKEATLHAL